MLRIEIHTENAAFDGDLMGEELATILRRIAEDVTPLASTSGRHYFTIRDTNGNVVGTTGYEPA